MTPELFAAVYNPLTRCHCTYKSAHGDTRTGLVLDGRQTSTTGAKFICVDTFANRIKLNDLQSVWNTGRPWTARQATQPQPAKIDAVDQYYKDRNASGQAALAK